jgi:hypothetical protein
MHGGVHSVPVKAVCRRERRGEGYSRVCAYSLSLAVGPRASHRNLPDLVNPDESTPVHARRRPLALVVQPSSDARSQSVQASSRLTPLVPSTRAPARARVPQSGVAAENLSSVSSPLATRRPRRCRQGYSTETCASASLCSGLVLGLHALAGARRDSRFVCRWLNRDSGSFETDVDRAARPTVWWVKEDRRNVAFVRSGVLRLTRGAHRYSFASCRSPSPAARATRPASARSATWSFAKMAET